MMEWIILGMFVVGALIVFVTGASVTGWWDDFWHNRMVEELRRMDEQKIPLTWTVWHSLPRRHKRHLLQTRGAVNLREAIERNSSVLET